jgi:hypothetical protein
MVSLEIRRHAERVREEGSGRALSAAGIAAARGLRRGAAEFALVISSPRERARETDHYIPGLGRIDAYSPGEPPTVLTIYFTVGAGDVARDASVTEESHAVTVKVNTSVFVAGDRALQESCGLLQADDRDPQDTTRGARRDRWRNGQIRPVEPRPSVGRCASTTAG